MFITEARLDTVNKNFILYVQSKSRINQSARCQRCCMTMFLICSFFKKSEFGLVEKKYLQLNIKGVLHAVFEDQTTHFIGEMSY